MHSALLEPREEAVLRKIAEKMIDIKHGKGKGMLNYFSPRGEVITSDHAIYGYTVCIDADSVKFEELELKIARGNYQSWSERIEALEKEYP